MFERGWCKADREVWFGVSSAEGLGSANLAEAPPPRQTIYIHQQMCQVPGIQFMAREDGK